MADIHIARHVNIEAVNQDRLADDVQYSHSVNRARVLVRSFEATTQALYDDCAAIFLTTQRVRRIELCESWRGRDEAYDSLQALCSSLNANLELLCQNLENLLLVGEEQTDILERYDKSRIELRMSHRSLMAVFLAGQAVDETTNGKDPYADLISENNDTSQQSIGEESSLLSLAPSGRRPPLTLETLDEGT